MSLSWMIKVRRSVLLECEAEKYFKIQALGHQADLGATCQAGFAFKASLLTCQGREDLIWCRCHSLCNITQWKSSKRTCPTLTQQNGVSGMWSAEEGSRTSSGHWFPLHGGLPLPRQTPCKPAAPQGAALPTPRVGQQMCRNSAITDTRNHPWVQDQEPRLTTPSS